MNEKVTRMESSRQTQENLQNKVRIPSFKFECATVIHADLNMLSQRVGFHKESKMKELVKNTLDFCLAYSPEGFLT